MPDASVDTHLIVGAIERTENRVGETLAETLSQSRRLSKQMELLLEKANIKLDEQTLAIDRQTEKIAGQSDLLRELTRTNAGVLALLERADIKIAD